MFPWNISNKKNKSGRNRIISDAQSKPIDFENSKGI
jgi:hypothetical protein